VAAGLVAPVVAGLGVGARDGAEAFTEMPEELEIQPLAERSRMTDADGNTLAVFFEENRIEVPLDKISQEMQDAILAIEDHRFYEHGPLDIQGASRAFVGNLQAGETTSGGSTLTQQYVKLLLLDQAESADERAETLADSGPQGYFRKLRELRVALGVEQRMTKDEILAAYLNIANFGGPSGRSNYGIEAAARYYFSTSAEELTLPQAGDAGRPRSTPVRVLPGRQSRGRYRQAEHRDHPDGRTRHDQRTRGERGKAGRPWTGCDRVAERVHLVVGSVVLRLRGERNLGHGRARGYAGRADGHASPGRAAHRHGPR
jgi:hypothetical protein